MKGCYDIVASSKSFYSVFAANVGTPIRPSVQGLRVLGKLIAQCRSYLVTSCSGAYRDFLNDKGVGGCGQQKESLLTKIVLTKIVHK